MTPEILQRLRTSLAAGQPALLATRLDDGAQALFTAAGLIAAAGLDPAQIPPQLRDAAGPGLASGRSGIVAADGAQWFLHLHAPALRLIIIGAVHAGQALAQMAALAGFAVHVIDPRRAFATVERFPAAQLHPAWPDEAMRALAPDAASAVVALSHDPKLDDPALIVALGSPAFYVGALGSRKTHAARCDRLRAQGLAPELLARIHGPVGLAIGALTAPEIAISILAQIIATYRQAA